MFRMDSLSLDGVFRSVSVQYNDYEKEHVPGCVMVRGCSKHWQVLCCVQTGCLFY